MKHLLVGTFLLYAIPAAAETRLVPGMPLRDRADVYEASGRFGLMIRQKLRFGPFATTSVRRGAISRWGGATDFTDRVWVHEEVADQSIRYTLTDGTDTMQAVARSGLQRTSIVLGNNPNSLPNVITDILTTGTELHQNNFSVALQQLGGGQAWELFLDNNSAQIGRKQAAGYLRSDSTYYTIVPVWKIARKGRETDLLFGSVGFEFQTESGESVAAVDLMNKGAVHLLPGLPPSERLVLATACTALLLQSNLDE